MDATVWVGKKVRFIESFCLLWFYSCAFVPVSLIGISLAAHEGFLFLNDWAHFAPKEKGETTILQSSGNVTSPKMQTQPFGGQVVKGNILSHLSISTARKLETETWDDSPWQLYSTLVWDSKKASSVRLLERIIKGPKFCQNCGFLLRRWAEAEWWLTRRLTQSGTAGTSWAWGIAELPLSQPTPPLSQPTPPPHLGSSGTGTAALAHRGAREAGRKMGILLCMQTGCRAWERTHVQQRQPRLG